MNKINKIIISMIIALVIGLVCTQVFVSKANDNDKFIINGENLEVEAGNEVEILVKVYSTEMKSFSGLIEYDSDLQLISMNSIITVAARNSTIPETEKSINEEVPYKEKEAISLAYVLENEFTEGELEVLKLKFKIPDTAKQDSTYNIRLNENNTKTYILTKKGKPRPISLQGCTLYVKKGVVDNTQSGNQDGTQSGNQDGTQSGNQDGTQSGNQDGTQSGNQDGTQSGNQDGTQSGNQDGAQSGNQDGTQSGNKDGTPSAITGNDNFEEIENSNTLNSNINKKPNEKIPDTGEYNSFIIIVLSIFVGSIIFAKIKYKSSK